MHHRLWLLCTKGWGQEASGCSAKVRRDVVMNSASCHCAKRLLVYCEARLTLNIKYFSRGETTACCMFGSLMFVCVCVVCVCVVCAVFCVLCDVCCVRVRRAGV